MTKCDPADIPKCAVMYNTICDVLHYQGNWYEFDASHYRRITKEYVLQSIVDTFSRMSIAVFDKEKKKLSRKKYYPTIHWARGLREYLAGRVVPDPPTWLNNEAPYPPHEILVCSNGLLHIPSRTLLPHSPTYFGISTSNAAYVDYPAPLEEAPAFASMLTRVWPDDRPSIHLMQEIMGYLLTPDPPGQEVQKCFLFRGAARAGKGTCVKIIETLVGENNCTQLAAENIVRSPFALSPLLNKRVAMLGDLRVEDDKEITRKLLPILLKIVGGDHVSIDRKYCDPVHQRINTKLILESNTDLGIHDTSGALAARIIPVVFPSSFVGREDPSVPAAILSERDAILSWALAGWDRVTQRRVTGEPLFRLSPASERELAEIKAQGSAVPAFLASYVQDPEGQEPVNQVFKKWKLWARSRGVVGRDQTWLVQQIRSVWPKIITKEIKQFGEPRRKYLCGIRGK